MPVYHRPRVAIIDPGGADVGGLVLIAAAIAAAVAVVLFVAAHLVLLAVCAAVFVTVMGAVIAAMRWAASPRRLRQQHYARPTVRIPAARQAQALPAPRPAIGAPPRTLPAADAVNRDRSPHVR